MAHITFEIPVVVSGLLEENCEHYYVKEVVNVKRLPGKLKEAKELFKEEGVQYIIDYFDTYISVILNITQLSRDVQVTAFEDLHRAMKELNRSIEFILNDKDALSDEEKMKYLNIVKMLIYAYVNVTITVNNKDPSNAAYKKGKAASTDSIVSHKSDVIDQINTILQQEINIFWDPPVVEEPLINQIAEVCYSFIENNTSIKSQKTLCADIFNLFGILLTNYRYGTRFVYRIAELVKSYEHAVLVVSDGIKLLVESYNARSLVREFVRQVTEWQSDEKYQNAQATRNCAHVLSEMAKSMPEFMLEEVMYLTEYLNHESYSLRISVLNVITEVILTSLTKPELSNDERESRDEFFEILSDHMMDVTAFVRARVIQNWSRLQKENVLTSKMQTQILRKVIEHLRDKGSIVRKAAVNCVTSFLEHNPFGSELKLKHMEEVLTKEKAIYEEMAEKHCAPQFQKLKQSQESWKNIKDDIIKVIENNLSNENDDSEDEEEFNVTRDQIPIIVQSYLEEKKYGDAFKVTKKAVEHIEGFSDLRNTIEHETEAEFFMKLIRNFYLDFQQLLHLTDGDNEGVQNLNKQQELINYYEDVVNFLKVLEKALQPMKDLLESVNISEMQDAVDFFIVTYKFNIDNALQGILEMLRIMQRPEQDRKVAVTNALKTIFLETNAPSMPVHRKMVVDRLINFMEIVTFDKVDSFKLVIYNWVTEGKLDNNIIECVFQYFIKKEDVTDDVSLKALQLLILIAPAKKTIVTKNLRMISELAFERRIDNMIHFSETCRLLTAGTTEQQLVTDKKPPFKLKPTDPIWTHIINILCEHFDNIEMAFYNAAVKNAIRLIYVLCSKPDEVCETILKTILKKTKLSNEESSEDIPCFILIRLCVLLAEVAVCEFIFLDETVYKEIKRRLYVVTETANSKTNNRGNKDISTASLSRKNAAATTSIVGTDDGDDSVLEGAQADDAEADFILNVLENKIVTSPTSLGSFVPLIVTICENPDKYDDEHLQCVAVLALLRYMLVSSKFCASYIRLVFTILEKTKYREVKCTIVINLSDLLERFPNIIEPWSLHLFKSLNNTDLKVQKTTFYMLANLVLRDMLRVKSHIAFMAMFISKENDELSVMSKNFFSALSAKDNHLYNVLPDIFSHLVSTKDIDEDRFRFIMKHLINLITSTKHTENLVDRLCIKFSGTEDVYVCRNIAYCLSLLQYNEKAVKKFLDNFNLYKHILHDSDVYTFVKQTINSWTKLVRNDVKAIIAELEDKINSVFQVNENGDDPNCDKSIQPKPVFKKPKPKSIRKHKKRIVSRRNSDSDDEDCDISLESSNASVRRSNRTMRSNRSVSD